MSTATTRLRRAGAGGLAAAVVATTLVASTGLASAATFPVTAGTYSLVTPGSATTVYPGASGQAGADVVYWSTNNFTTNATLTFRIGTQICDTAAAIASAVGFNAAPTATISAVVKLADGTSTTSTTPVATGALGSFDTRCATAGVKDTFTLTFPSPANTPSAANGFSVTLSGIKYNVGSGATPGNVSLGATVTGSLSTPGAAVVNAVIANTKLATAGAVAATTGSSAVPLGNITASDIGGSVITSKLFFVANAGRVFGTATPTVTGGGLTWTVTGMGTATLTATGVGTLTAAANTFVLSGATLGTTGTPNPVGLATVKASFGAALPGTAIGTVTVASVVTQDRKGGVDRFATAASLFSGTTAVLASGLNFPDALSANYLANVETAKTLLTFPTVLPSVTFNALITNKVTTVYIVGGPGAVSTSVENQIAGTHQQNNPTLPFINVVRIAGIDRYATNKAVNEFVFKSQPMAIVATGENFADALAVGPAVAAKGIPLILTTSAALSSTASQQLADMGVKNVVIVGGTGAVSSAVETAIKGMGITITARLAGTDRTQTAAAIATWETNATSATPVPGLGFTGTSNVYIANGANFPDALAAGPVAGAGQNVILLTLTPTSLGTGAPTYLATMGGTVTTLTALGLTGAVSPAVMNAAAVALAG